MPEPVVEGAELPTLKFRLTPEQAREKWYEALESGKYKQGRGHLASVVELKDGVTVETHCCLGVACEVFIKEEPEHALSVEISKGLKYFDGEICYLPWRVKQWLGVVNHGNSSLKLAPEIVPEQLRKSAAFKARQLFFADGAGEANIVELNDGLSSNLADDTVCTFEQIAKVLRANPPGLTAPMPDPPGPHSSDN